MATSRRVERVAELIKREISQLLLSGIKDDRVGQAWSVLRRWKFPRICNTPRCT